MSPRAAWFAFSCDVAGQIPAGVVAMLIGLVGVISPFVADWLMEMVLGDD